jgi:phosphoserine phosphatase
MLGRMFPKGFIYAGDSKADLAVWARAAGVILVNPRKSVRDAALALGRPTLELSGRV